MPLEELFDFALPGTIWKPVEVELFDEIIGAFQCEHSVFPCQRPEVDLAVSEEVVHFLYVLDKELVKIESLKLDWVGCLYYKWTV